MNLTRAAFSASRMAGRSLRQAPSRPISSPPPHPGYKTTEALKEQLSIEDGTPVYIKRGSLDRLLFGVTAAACTVAVIWDFKVYYDFALR